jgi:hypothetical protein
MNERDELHAAFRAMLDHPEPAAVDRRQAVSGHIARIRRQRAAAGALSAVVLLGGAGVVFTQVRNHDRGASQSVQSLQSAPGAKLSIAVDGGPTGRVGRAVTLQVTLTGLAESPDDYGIQIKYGPGQGYRAYGTSHCVLTTPVNADIRRTYSTTYNSPGTYRITAVATLCGVVKSKAETSIVITR